MHSSKYYDTWRCRITPPALFVSITFLLYANLGSNSFFLTCKIRRNTRNSLTSAVINSLNASHQGVKLTFAQSNMPCANQINQTETASKTNLIRTMYRLICIVLSSHIAKQQSTSSHHTMVHAVCALSVFAMRLNTR